MYTYVRKKHSLYAPCATEWPTVLSHDRVSAFNFGPQHTVQVHKAKKQKKAMVCYVNPVEMDPGWIALSSLLVKYVCIFKILHKGYKYHTKNNKGEEVTKVCHVI